MCVRWRTLGRFMAPALHGTAAHQPPMFFSVQRFVSQPCPSPSLPYFVHTVGFGGLRALERAPRRPPAAAAPPTCPVVHQGGRKRLADDAAALPVTHTHNAQHVAARRATPPRADDAAAAPRAGTNAPTGPLRSLALALGGQTRQGLGPARLSYVQLCARCGRHVPGGRRSLLTGLRERAWPPPATTAVPPRGGHMYCGSVRAYQGDDGSSDSPRRPVGACAGGGYADADRRQRR